MYSSSQTGQNDGFVINYAINQSLINAGGKYRGRLVFTVRGMTDGSTDQAIIDVFLETTSSLKVSVQGAHSFNRIQIKSTDTTQNKADYVKISFQGNAGGEIKIYQESQSYPQNESGQQLGSNALQLDAAGDPESIKLEGLMPLTQNRILVYSSNKGEDSFIIYFLTNTIAMNQQDSGVYNGRINYIIETDQGKQEFPIDVQTEIPAEFSVNVTAESDGINFTHVMANSPPVEKEVLVTVISNLHKPYQVLQNLQTNMTNTQGKEFDSQYFNMQVVIPADQRGRTDYLEYAPVKLGENPIFSSDANGHGATFKVVYRLQGYPQMSPGNFSAPIRFSLNQK